MCGFLAHPFVIAKPEFDEFRNLVRFGSLSEWQLFNSDTTPILADETAASRRVVGHLATFDWNSARDGFLVQVSLFHAVTYRFRLCKFGDRHLILFLRLSRWQCLWMKQGACHRISCTLKEEGLPGGNPLLLAFLLCLAPQKMNFRLICIVRLLPLNWLASRNCSEETLA